MRENLIWRVWAVAVTVAAAAVLGVACTSPRSGEPAESRIASSPADPSPDIEQPPAPLADATRPVAGARAALEVLTRPDIRPTVGHVSEDGDLLVWWELRGLRDRDVYRCHHPVVLTWAPADVWSRGARAVAVRAWLLADGQREVVSTPTGFFLNSSTCSGRSLAEQAGALSIGDAGRLRAATVSSAREVPPRNGAVTVSCPAPARGSCQYDAASGRVWRLPGRLTWSGAWNAETSVLWRPTTHISGTWSVDAGTSWNEFMDTWDASPLRSGGATLAMSNGVRSSFGELAGEGLYREGYVEWAPWDRQPVVQLPRSTDGYRWWQTAPDGTLVGIGRAGGVYVSEGTNWHQVSRRGTGRCGAVELVGRLLVCGPLRATKGSEDIRVMRVSDDLGRTWTGVFMNRVVPRAEPG